MNYTYSDTFIRSAPHTYVDVCVVGPDGKETKEKAILHKSANRGNQKSKFLNLIAEDAEIIDIDLNNLENE